MKPLLATALLVILCALPLAAQTTTTFSVASFTFKGCGSPICLEQPEKNGQIEIKNPATGVTLRFVGRWSGVGISTQTLNLNNGQFFIETGTEGRTQGIDALTGYRVLGKLKIVNEYRPNPKSPMDIQRLGIYTEEPIIVQNFYTLQTVYSVTLKDLNAPVAITSNFVGGVTSYDVACLGNTGTGSLTYSNPLQFTNPRQLVTMLAGFITLPLRSTGRR